MKKAVRQSLGLFCLAALMAGSAGAQRRGWERLGEAHVDGQADHDVIRVTAARGEFRAIRMRVENAAIDFDRVLVHYGNGTTHPVELRYQIRAGEETRAIDLPGDRRVVESVEFWYHRGSWREVRPKVVLFGMH